MAGQQVGYVRVSSIDQNTERQLDGLVLDKIFTDHASGKDMKRAQLQAAIEYVREGDTLVVHSIDRLGRSLLDLLQTIKTLNERKVVVRFMKEDLTFAGKNTPMADLQLGIIGICAQYERALILDRQREGIAIAKKKGVYKGRKRALNDEQAAELRRRVATREKKTAIARDLGISRDTLYQYLRPAAPASSAA